MEINPRKISLRFFSKAIDNAESLLYNLATVKKTTAPTQTGKQRKEQRSEQSRETTKY